MDDTAQNQLQNPVQNQGGTGGQGDKGIAQDDQSLTKVMPLAAVQGSTLGTVGSTQKEQGPSLTWQGPVVTQEPLVQVQTGQKELTPSEVELKVNPEAAEAGVEAVQKPQVSQDVIKIGLEPAKENVAVQTQPSGLVNLPMTEEEAEKVIKTHKKVTDSILWLATEIVRQFKIMHGKIIK